MVDINKLVGRARRSAIASDILAVKKYKIKKIKPRKIVKKIVPKRFGIEKARVILKPMKFKKAKYGKKIGEITERKKVEGLKLQGVSNIKDATAAGERTLIMRVEISEWTRKLVPWLGSQDLINDLIKCMDVMYFDLYRYINDKKSQLIPTNTGALKRSLLRSLTARKRYISSGILMVEIGTHLPYLVWVHEMETSGTKPHLRHPPYAKRGGGFTGSKKKASYVPKKDDPKAVKHFLDWIIIEARKKANQIFTQRVAQMIYPKWKNFFGWIRWTQATMLFNRVKW